MEIIFEGKYKSLTSFTWSHIPKFVIITGPNGTGKSQLLELIKDSIGITNFAPSMEFIDAVFLPHEVIFLKGEWQLQNTSHINLSSIQQNMDGYYSNFVGGNYESSYSQHKLFYACKEIKKKTGKGYRQVTREEFDLYFPEILIEQESQLSQKIGETFYNYRLNEIELQASGISAEEIKKRIGEKPWYVMRDIIKESKLPFAINDPSTNGFRDGFQFRLTHEILNEEINFNDLSSGEKVLMSLVFYLYNSQEKNLFPKLLLLDEPDAHLHPSMSQQFLNVVKNVLVDKFQVQVIMTTHSPSTVMLAPESSIYEMSRVEPRIKKSPSRNHAVSLLTSGIVYVGEGTKYFLVEDNDDVNFYSYIYNQLASENQINSDIPLVFISASTKDKSGGKDVVQNWVNKLQESGLDNILNGLIDADSGNSTSQGVYKIERYSIENYLVDPIVVYAALIDKEKNPQLDDLNLNIGEEYKLKSLSNENLQKIADSIIELIEPHLSNYFDDFGISETERVEVVFLGDKKVLYPKWLLHRRGKTLLNEIYNHVFTSPIINFTTLFKAFRKLNMFPSDIVEKLSEIKNVS